MATTNFVNGTVVQADWLNDVDEVVYGLPTSAGSSVVGFLQAGTGAVQRSTQSKLREHYSVFDAGAVGDNSSDDTAEQQTAINYVQSTYDPATYSSASPANGPCELFYPAGYYRTTGQLTVSRKIAFKGDGPAEFSSGSRVVQFAPANDLFRLSPIVQGSSVSFENMTLIGIGNGAGHLINVQRGPGTCNSQRYYSLVFGTPPSLALNVQAGDDIVIDNVLVDVSATSAFAFGSSAAADAVSNVRMSNPNFFGVLQRCNLLYNIDGMQITAPQVYHQPGVTRTQYFIDAYNTLPYKVKDVTINGGNLKKVDCLIEGQNLINFKAMGLTCSDFGLGASSARSGIELYGTCSGITISGNTFEGDFGSRHFYNDFGATVTRANITGNTFINTSGGTGAALNCINTSGVIANNTFIGFTAKSVSELVTTTGSAINPGTIASLASWDYIATVVGARQGDVVTVSSVATTWPVAPGVEIEAFVSAPNTVTIQYRNSRAASVVVPAHDIRYVVNRYA